MHGPFLLVFVGMVAGIWLNHRDYVDLKANMNRQFDAVNAHLAIISVLVERGQAVEPLRAGSE